MSANSVISGLLSILAGGVLGTGGIYVYKYSIPVTWKEYLEREGFSFVNSEDSDNYYKALFIDNEERRKQIDELKDVKDTSNDYHTKLKEWCEKKLKEISDKNNTTKDQLVNLCSYKGINTVKGRMFQAGKTEWLKEDDQYKSVFAVYRYSDEFLKWLNEEKDESNKIQKTDKPSQKYQELKTKCETETKKKYSDTKDPRYNYIFWWCTPLPYDTVEKRIKHINQKWEKETTGSAIKTAWEHTSTITQIIKTDQNKESSDLSDDDYLSWCTTQLTKTLAEDDIYQDKYLKIKSVCKKTK